jgi:general secretion pathway protein A
MVGYQYTIKFIQLRKAIMYLEHYGLKLKPFSISPDPQFLWLGERHREALATLRYGIIDNKGFLLLTGDVGTGKTVLINRLIKLIDVKVTVATIPDPGLGLIDFYNILADEFKMNRIFNQKGEFLINFKTFLTEAYGAQKTVLLIIDEAQRLAHELLDEIRVLSNIDFNGSKLINIFLVGQSELRAMLMEERNRPFRQRITVNFNIEPLNERETASFIEHRLKIAGATRRYFTADAMSEVHTFSKGFPRLINVMCDHALMSGYSAGLTMLNGGIIKECAKDLQISVNADAQTLNKKMQAEYPTPARQPKADEYTGELKILGESPFLKTAGFIVIILILIGVIISFFNNSPFDKSLNLVKSDNRIAIVQSSTGKEKAPPTTIAISEDDTMEMPANMAQSENIKAVNSIEKTEIDKKQPDKDLMEIKTDAIAVDEATRDQLPENTFTEDKKSIVDEKVTPVVQATNQSPKPQGKHLHMELIDKKFLVSFERDSTEIASKDFETLAKIAEYLFRDSNPKVIVEGYTDSYGNNFYNQKLSQLRANMVKSYFVGQGIAISRISAIGLGSENPIADNENREGRSKNRRVEIKFRLSTEGDVKKKRHPN